jgi:mannose/cellobiose epimerase-like protein (N-acyl-D-glucosamine 2-epimerase family)
MKYHFYCIILFIFLSFHAKGQYIPTSQWFQEPELLIDYVEDCAAFWQGTADLTYDGYFMEIARDGSTYNPNASKSIVQHSRLAYGFVRAFMLTGNTEYLDHAEEALEFMQQNLWDEDYGGWFSTCSRTGTNPYQGNKTAFDQHYALLGLTAMTEATLDPEWSELLMDGWDFNESALWDDQQGRMGYFHEVTRTGADGSNKSFNATVDAITTHVYNLYLMTGEQKYLDRLLGLQANILDYMVGNMDEQAIGFPEHFNTFWDIDEGQRGSLMGHVLKTGWCLARIYRLQPDPEVISGAEKLIKDVLDHGYDHQYGGPYKDFDRITGQMQMYGAIDTAKAWWQMEQAITGGLLLWEITGKDEYIEMADESLDFFMKEFVDPLYGEVYADRARDGGRVYYPGGYWDENKAGLWKSGYHSIETGYYGYLYGKLLVNWEPATLYYYFEPAEEQSVRMNPLAIDFDRLKIESVMLNGEAYNDFDENSRILNISPSQPGLFAVTYKISGSQSTNEYADIPFDFTGVYPNPFSSHANIRLSLDRSSDVELRLTNTLGQSLVFWKKNDLLAGRHNIPIRGEDLQAGIYFITITANGFSQTRRCIVRP